MKNKLLTMLDTKTKKIVLAGLVVVILCISGFGVYALTKEKEIVLSLKKDKETIAVEYGDAINPTLEEYLDLSELDKNDKSKVLKESKLESTLKNEEGKDYPGIGEYEITFTLKKSKVVSRVAVKDTVAPVFNDVNDVSFEEGTDFNYAEKINATDLSKVEVTFDSSAVNKDLPGEYVTKTLAKDVSGNETTKDIKVVVTAKPVIEIPKTETPANKSTTGTNGSTSTTTKPSGGSSGTGTTTKPATPTPEAPHVHNGTPFKGELFDNGAELMKWAREYQVANNGGGSYGTNQCTCGKWYITYFAFEQ